MDVLNHCSDLLSSDNYRLQKDALLSPNAVLPTLRATTPEMCSFFLQRSICVVWIKTCIWLRVSYPLYESEIAYTSVCGPSALQAVQEHRSVLPTVMAEAVSETLAEDCVSDCFSSHSSVLHLSDPDMSRPTHELRAISSSMALHQGASMDQIIRAVGWSSGSTFAQFYLRHMRLAERQNAPTSH